MGPSPCASPQKGERHAPCSCLTDLIKNSVHTSTSTHCPYCALQCGMHLITRESTLEVMGNTQFPVNRGGLCAKGWACTATLDLADRLLTPLARNTSGV